MANHSVHQAELQQLRSATSICPTRWRKSDFFCNFRPICRKKGGPGKIQPLCVIQVVKLIFQYGRRWRADFTKARHIVTVKIWIIIEVCTWSKLLMTAVRWAKLGSARHLSFKLDCNPSFAFLPVTMIELVHLPQSANKQTSAFLRSLEV